MQKCPGCPGFIQVNDPRKIVEGKVYHLHCGFKAEEEIKRAVKQSTKESEVVQSPQQA